MLYLFRNEKHTCRLCFGDLRKLEKAPSYYSLICRLCWRSERNRLRSNNKSKRSRKYSTERISVRSWINILSIHNWSCAHCGVRGRHKLTLDHILPLNKGGNNNEDNIQPLCVPCHEKKDGYVRKPLWWFKRIIRKMKNMFRKHSIFSFPLKLLK